MKNIFRELQTAHQVLSLELRKEEYANIPNESPDIRKKREAYLNDLYACIDTGLWCPNSPNKVEFLEYYRCKPKVYALKTGKSLDNVNHIFRRMSERLRSYVGYDCVYRILTEDPANLSIMMFDLKLAFKPDLICRFISEPLKPFITGTSSGNEYSISELQTELAFLRIYSTAFMQKLQKEVNADKMNYLISVINRESGEDFSKVAEIFRGIHSKQDMSRLFKAFLNCKSVSNLSTTTEQS
jgi:hypothetical protein